MNISSALPSSAESGLLISCWSASVARRCRRGIGRSTNSACAALRARTAAMRRRDNERRARKSSGGHRLRDELVAAGVEQRLSRRLGMIAPVEKQDEDLVLLVELANAAADLEAVDDRQVDVEQTRSGRHSSNRRHARRRPPRFDVASTRRARHEERPNAGSASATRREEGAGRGS